MTDEISFGHLYHPTPNGGVFRDIYLSHNNDLYCRDFSTSGIESLLFGAPSYIPINISQFLGVLGNAADLLTILGSAKALVKIVASSNLWKKFIQPFRKSGEIKNLWPKTLASAKGEVWDLLSNNLMALKSDIAVRQGERIVDNASEELRVFRVAFSDDLVKLYAHLDKIRRGCKVELNLASAKSLRSACHNELSELEKRANLFENMRVEFDFQAKSKYLKESSANFARAASDSLCAIRAVQNYIQFNASTDEAKRFSLHLFNGEPSFRGTMTENEIGYVSTPPWTPGMIGDLHSHIRDQDNMRTWDTAKKSFLAEIKKSMKPVEQDYYTASKNLRSAAIDAIFEAERRHGKSRDDVVTLEKMIREIDTRKPESRGDINNAFEKIKEQRRKLRDAFGEIYPRLDETISSTW